ncbi:MAG: polyphosphate kinase 1 [Verrucomicrobia bacterium]|nr:polyphosphate kinase 1 [Verrucomicrobiota bacterium]
MAKKEDLFLNRELSWLEFNQRVLNEALDSNVPLLERLKFLAITASNLNEFFMVRVGGLQMVHDAGRRTKDPSGLTPLRQLEAISQRVHRMVKDQYDVYLKELDPMLRENGIKRVRSNELTDRQSEHIDRFFDAEVYPVITPMALESASAFPVLKNLAENLLVRLAPEKNSRRARYALIPMPGNMSRFVSLPSESGYEYMLVEDLVSAYVGKFFPGIEVLECVSFRITRNADLAVREDMASDLLAGMEDILAARRTSDCVRLAVADTVSRAALAFLTRCLRTRTRDVYRISGPIGLDDFMSQATMDGFEHLKYESWTPQPSPMIDPKESIFMEIARRNLLLYHPYESFDPVLRFVDEAADDPDVLAIKQILYRTSRNSPIVNALRRAAANGKSVTALVELKARFDEARNIGWAKRLEEEGVQVIYGVKGFKTHAKICIVVRREPHGIVRYMHFGTGNYNEATAKMYGDISYLTCDPDLGADASAFFNMISGYSEPRSFRKLNAAPIGLRDQVMAMIQGETQRKQQGRKAKIMAKMNSLVDPTIIKALYDASQAGVEVLLNVRGICCLRPGVKGLSENIMVTSIIDRYLEHARIFYFYHGGEPQVYISSADWMPRNLDKRVELLTPIDDAASRKKLTKYLEVHFQDTVKASVLQPDGAYVRPDAGKKRQSQQILYRTAQEAAQRNRQTKRTTFEPHKPEGTDRR